MQPSRPLDAGVNTRENVQGLCKIKKKRNLKHGGPPCFHDADDVTLERVGVHEKPRISYMKVN